ncbi:hypothetical protein P43SY_011583 [Pythium insidiosum]|uniref:TAZ-type domain-containing protein n=1 Tax=Pythium insidiosum TaxID=114742 RepID=A0AAD5LRG0_PYTIN|nr:hypothetical protein P43SY_011583 [Pythium insidiosum]
MDSTHLELSPSDSVEDRAQKIRFAKELLFHASTCVLPQGVCHMKKCDDVRRVCKHSVSCNDVRECKHCKQLKALVEYHAEDLKMPGSG